MTQALLEVDQGQAFSGDSDGLDSTPGRELQAESNLDDWEATWDEFAGVASNIDPLDHGRLRAHRILSQKIEFIFSPEFEDPQAVETILGPPPPARARQATNPKSSTLPPPPGTPPYLSSLYKTPLLTREQEHHLFRKMNFLKYRADLLRKDLDPQRPRVPLLDQIESLLDQALTIRNQIVQANLRLVVSIAKKLVDRANSFDEVVSDGNVPLIRAVEIFDFERGTRFSTYATWAIRNSLYRSTPRNRKYRKRFATGTDTVFSAASDQRASVLACENSFRELRQFVASMLSQLDERDQTIVVSRFGLGDDDRPRKFREIAEDLNLSTERVRQLLGRSLDQMRDLAETEQVALPDVENEPLNSMYG